jgi:5-methyltetrahydrofolate--homocysteine methyltransferase
VKILVGGAPVTKEYAAEIGADGYGANAISGVELGKQLLQ